MTWSHTTFNLKSHFLFEANPNCKLQKNDRVPIFFYNYPKGSFEKLEIVRVILLNCDTVHLSLLRWSHTYTSSSILCQHSFFKSAQWGEVTSKVKHSYCMYILYSLIKKISLFLNRCYQTWTRHTTALIVARCLL